MKRLPPALLAALLLLPAGVVAQGAGDATGADPCPTGYACVSYRGVVLEIDKTAGAIQGFVWDTSETVTESLAETETSRSGTSVWLAASGATYAVVAEDVPLTAAQAAVAEPGDPMVGRLAVKR